MSQRNSKTAKAAARERLRAQREKEAKRAKVRRQFMVGGGVVVLLAIAGGVAFAVNEMNKPKYWEKAADNKLVAPANSSGKNGTIVVVGDKDNKNVVHEYEDLRCPYCAAYEQTAGAAVLQGAKDGKYQINYSFAAFIDNHGGTGSKKALSALGAALNVSTDAFEQYHTLLYSKDVHPDETEDKFGNGDTLIKLAQQVPALKNNAKFSDAVKKGTFDKWALTVADAYNKDPASAKGTPYVLVNGQQVEVNGVASDQVMAGIEAQLKK
ncbi:thioredoxin domain-containing protein [Actinacidiphila epipremni]|jgi:protein-disulfide isomerase|uniref:Thioredoxin domain-containing protein n=1 Tax=Actinacidiphila epipremni TaxID=2053013 RepID=A0ABX0ZP92_9ACTN|nr:thioredoxin domain-containing protein [Actinacidiphila epipremni]NJP44835.1 thioredoxin domain-containing protein [Actinacidiphila epipremni]